MKKLCKNCKYWRGEAPYDSFPKYKACYHPKLRDYWEINEEPSLIGNDELLAALDSFMVVGPEFGCIHFKRKK